LKRNLNFIRSVFFCYHVEEEIEQYQNDLILLTQHNEVGFSNLVNVVYLYLHENNLLIYQLFHMNQNDKQQLE
jgi:hypothetical protein